MTLANLEKRVAALEEQVAELQAAQTNGSHVQDWRETIGMFAGDEVMKEVFREALKIRDRDREQARRRFARTKRAKK